MKYNIIHIILVSMIGAALASCTSEPEPGATGTGEAMTFEAMEATATRASVTTNSDLTKKPFQLFGDVYRKGEYYHGLKVFFDGRKVTYQNGKWDYGEQLYWLMGQDHSFIAIHPHQSMVPEISDLKYSDSKVSFTFTLPANNNILNHKAVTDVLVATHRRVYTMDTSGAVRFGFRHLLTQVNIAPALDEALMYEDETDRVNYPYNEDEYILFTKVEVYGLKRKADFTIMPASLEDGQFITDERVDTYTVSDNGNTDAVITFDPPKKITNCNTNVNICDNEETLLFLPQEIGPDARIILYYKVNDDEPLRKITLPLYDMPLERWETGKVYTYKFTVEKAYTGQIRQGSMVIEIDDPRLEDTNDDAWMWDGTTIKYDFR